MTSTETPFPIRMKQLADDLEAKRITPAEFKSAMTRLSNEMKLDAHLRTVVKAPKADLGVRVRRWLLLGATALLVAYTGLRFAGVLQ